jgi:hypothetical protein
MSDHEQTAEEREQIERAKALTASFAASTAPIAGERLRAITQADLLILGSVGNRFASGFSAQERVQAERGNMLPCILDVIQWREVCRADTATREGWMDAPELFRAHCKHIAFSSPADIQSIGSMFSEVLAAFQRIQTAQVSVKEAPQAKGQVKKKAHNRHP